MSGGPSDESALEGVDSSAPGSPAVGSQDDSSGQRIARTLATTPAEQPLALDAPTQPPPARTLPFRQLRVHGRVVDGEGVPVTHARVVLFPSRKEREQTGQPSYYLNTPIPWNTWTQTVTGSDGRFVIEHTEVATESGHRLLQRAPGLLLHSPCLVVEHVGHAFRAQPLPDLGWDLSLGDVVLAPAAVITGRVVDVGMRPIAGARIVPEPGPSSQLAGWTWDSLLELASTSAGIEGRFRLDTLGSGPHRLRITAAGRRTEFRDVELVSGTSVDLGSIVLTRGAVLSGRVLDADRQLVPGAELLVATWPIEGEDMSFLAFRSTYSVAPGRYARRLTTESDGRFRAAGLDPIPHHLIVRATGCETQVVSDIPPETTGLEVVLQREAALALIVIDAATGQPLTDATVKVHPGATYFEPGFGPSLCAITGEEALLRLARNGHNLSQLDDTGSAGLFVAGPLSAVTNEASVSADGYERLAVVELPGLRPGELHWQTVALTARPGLDPENNGSVSGRTTDTLGVALPHVDVTANPSRSSGATKVQGVSDADGRFTLAGLPAGRWWLSGKRVDRRSAKSAAFDVSAGAHIEDIVLSLDAGGRLSGTVLAAGDRPANLQLVELRRAKDASHRTPRDTKITAASGRFLFQALTPGDYVVSALPGAPVAVTLRSGEETIVDLRIETPASLRGTVRDASGNLLAVDVKLFPSKDAPSTRAIDAESDALGVFRFDNLPSMRGRLVAFLNGAQTPAQDVDLEWGDTAEHDLVFGGSRFVGRVKRVGTQEPVPGVKVYALGLGAEQTTPTSNAMQASCVTDARGRFDLPHLIPGTYRLSTYRGEWVNAADTPVELAVDGLVTHDLEVVQTATLTGSVTLIGARPVDTRLSIQLERTGSTARPRVVTLKTSGEYTVRHLRAGSWRYVVIPRRYSPNPVDPAEVYASGAFAVEPGGTTVEDLVVVVPVGDSG